MSDFKLSLSTTTLEYDLEFSKGDFSKDDGLRSAVIISLFTDARITDEELELGETEKRGFWGDTFAEIDEDKLGSKLWRLSRAKQTDENLNKSREFVEKALLWLLTYDVASKVIVETSYPNRDCLLISVQIEKPTGEIIDFKFSTNWEAELT